MLGKKKSKTVRPNQFQDAEDIYLTKNKIAVTKLKVERRNNINRTIVTIKYYERNDRNLRKLRKVQPEVRRGRNGNKYEKI